MVPILVVEERNEVRSQVCSILAQAGYEVAQASDGISGLEILSLELTKKYLLITDIKMSLLNGDAMIAEAFDLGIKFAAIIILTGDSYVGNDFAKLIARGQAKLLLKPVASRTLLALVNTLMCKISE